MNSKRMTLTLSHRRSQLLLYRENGLLVLFECVDVLQGLFIENAGVRRSVFRWLCQWRVSALCTTFTSRHGRMLFWWSSLRQRVHQRAQVELVLARLLTQGQLALTQVFQLARQFLRVIWKLWNI